MVGLQRVAEPVDDEELDAIDGSVAEGDEDIARKRKAMTTLRMTLTSNVIAVRGPDIRPFFLPLRATSFTATLVTLYLHPEAELRPLKYLASFRTTLKVSRYLFRALALLIWLLIAFVSVFYIVNALHQRESEIRQEFNLSSDQAQRFIQRTSDVMKELKYIAENRLTAENGVMSSRARDDKMVVPDFEPLFADSDCAAMGSGADRWSRWHGLCVIGATTFQRRMILTAFS